MNTRDTTDPVIVGRVDAGPETSWNQAVLRAHAAVTGVLGDVDRLGEGSPPGWRPVAPDSAVWHG